MNKKIKKAWVEALRSGKYRQTRDYLKFDRNYCCLGVLCILHGKETGNKFMDGCYLGQSKELPDEVIEWSKIKGDCGILENKINGVYTLAELNDNGMNFKEIANIIEEQL